MIVLLCKASFGTCRLAQAVLSREDSQESFFKGIPSEVSDVEIIYPVSPYIPCNQVLCWGMLLDFKIEA